MNPSNLVTTVGGSTAALYHTIDWDKTSVGRFESWPESLKCLVSSMLSCPIPMYLRLGKDRTFL